MLQTWLHIHRTRTTKAGIASDRRPCGALENPEGRGQGELVCRQLCVLEEPVAPVINWGSPPGA